VINLEHKKISIVVKQALLPTANQKNSIDATCSSLSLFNGFDRIKREIHLAMVYINIIIEKNIIKIIFRRKYFKSLRFDNITCSFVVAVVVVDEAKL